MNLHEKGEEIREKVIIAMLEEFPALKKRIRECLRHYPPLDDRGKPFFSKDELTDE